MREMVKKEKERRKKERGEERNRFWKDMERTLDSVGNGYRLCILGDLYGWMGGRTRAGIIGAFWSSRRE